LINLELTPEVSQIDPTLPVSINGTGAPALLTRRTHTTVELRDGQSFAIAGLLMATNTRQQRQVPWVGQLPILGALFRSSSYQKHETDLVVLITAHLVRPSRPGDPLHSPLANSVGSDDAEFFLLGALEVTPQDIRRFSTGEGTDGHFGHIINTPMLHYPPRGTDAVSKK
jgi:pilus assembly protein CpaC